MDLAHNDELLSAYLDRELSPDERATVDRLLENSSEARERLHELEVTSRFMRTLPQSRRAGIDFADNVIDRLRSESLLRPEPVTPRPTNRRNVWWIGTPLAAAAALLFALGVWNYQGGHERLSREPGPFDPDNSNSELPGPIVASIDMDQWEKGDILEIRGPSGEREFELFVLSRAAEPNTIRCMLAESRDTETAKAEPIAPENQPAVTQGATTLAIEADQKQLDQIKALFAQWSDETAGASPLVDIVTVSEPERIRVAGVGPQTRSAGLGGNQGLFATRESDREYKATAADRSKEQAPPAFAAKEKGLNEKEGARRVRSVAQPAAPAGAEEEQMAESRVVVLSIGSGLPLVIPNPAPRKSERVLSEVAAAEKKGPAGEPVSLKRATALRDRGPQVPVRWIKQLDIRQQAAEAPDSASATSSQRSTPDHVENLVKSKPPTERPGTPPTRLDDKEPPGRRINVLLRFRNDPAE